MLHVQLMVANRGDCKSARKLSAAGGPADAERARRGSVQRRTCPVSASAVRLGSHGSESDALGGPGFQKSEGEGGPSLEGWGGAPNRLVATDSQTAGPGRRDPVSKGGPVLENAGDVRRDSYGVVPLALSSQRGYPPRAPTPAHGEIGRDRSNSNPPIRVPGRIAPHRARAPACGGGGYRVTRHRRHHDRPAPAEGAGGCYRVNPEGRSPADPARIVARVVGAELVRSPRRLTVSIIR